MNLEFMVIEPVQYEGYHSSLGMMLAPKLPRNMRYVSLRADDIGLVLYGWTEKEQGLDLTARDISAPYTIRVRRDETLSTSNWFAGSGICWVFCGIAENVMTDKLEGLHLDLDAVD